MSRFLLIVCIFIYGAANAQKVALVLSGGASKGFAHVGVIKALEENNIPIDYVVGTSMGSVVGGCYAAGLSIEEIDSILSSKDFNKWVNGDIHLENYYYFNSQEIGPSWINLDFSLDSLFSSSINSTLASDLAINFVLNEQFAGPSEIAEYNFDKLFVPFRAVASDIFTQETEVIRRGSLGNAVRASFSAPQFYRPIKVNNKYLFDGGIYNNFPVDVALEEFNPDVIIGVNVSDKIFEEYPYEQDDELINDALIYSLIDKSEPTSIDSSGIYIQPDLSGYSSLNFASPEIYFDSGYVAAMRAMPEILEKITKRTNPVALENARLNFNKKSKPLVFKSIELHNFTDRQEIFIRRAFKLQKRDSLTLDEVERGYYRLVSEEYFKTIYPDIVYNPQLKGYTLHLYGRPDNAFNVEVGGLIASRNVGHVYMGLKYYRFNKYFTKSYLKLYASNFHKSVQFRVRFLLPTARPIYLEPETHYNNWNYTSVGELFLPDQPPSVYVLTDRKYGGNIGIPVGRQDQLLLSGHIINNKNKFSNSDVLVSTDTLDEQIVNGVRLGSSLSRNTLNRPLYASRGQYNSLSIDAYRLFETYNPGNTSFLENNNKGYLTWVRGKLHLEKYFSPSENYSLGYLFELQASNDLRYSNYKSTIVNVPAFYPLQDSRTLFYEDYRAFNYAALGLRNVLTVRKNLDVRLEGYAFKPYNKLSSNQNQELVIEGFDLEDIRFSSSLSVVFHSPIGPLALNVNYYDNSNSGFGFFAHFGYVLFNKTSLE